ncbi:MAG: hypothetical protein LKI98_05160 [Bifidobacterium crudilactis]|jgi:hypothetical protein|nr:hypothetical protein [Bifidobacterium crudilactis]MCI1889811.1 hypothetical protein [Bifidobacterium crudilactis]
MSTTTEIFPDEQLQDVISDIGHREKINLLEAQAKRIATLQEEIRERQDSVDSIKAQILTQWEPGSYTAGNLNVQVKEGAKAINAAKFSKAFPPTEYPNLYKLSPDSKEARKQLGEQQLAPVMTSRKPSVVIA